MSSRALTYLLVASCATIGLAWLVAVMAVSTVERDTVSRISASLNAAGADWAQVDADGLQVILSGTADSELSRFRMLETVAQIVDTNRILDETEVKADKLAVAPEFSLEILRNDGDLSLFGLIPGNDARVTVLKALAKVREPESFTDLMESVDYDAPQGWQSALQFALRIAPDLERAHLVVRPGGVTVEAFLDSQQAMDAMHARLNARVPNGVELKLILRAPKIVVSPFVFEAELNADRLEVISCNADDDAAQAAIYTALSEFGQETDCQLALGAPSQAWGKAVVATLQSLQRMGGGAVKLSDTDVSMIAPLGMDEAVFAKEQKTLRWDLPEDFSLTATLPKKPEPRDLPEVVPPRLEAVLDNDGALSFSSPMRTTMALEATRNFAAARFGHGQTDADLIVDETVPEGWARRVLVGLDALSLLHDGTLHIDEDEFRIVGRSDTPETEAEIAALMAERLPATDYSADIRFDESLVVVDKTVTLSDLDCERSLASIMRQFQITFAPNSANIDDTSGVVIDEISAVLKSCPDARFEIGGHTDSQGRESMNLGLSQARAEAVLDALLARDVLLGNLEAKGYGEAEPIADNGTEEGRAANRRIAFKLMVPDPNDAETSETDEQN